MKVLVHATYRVVETFEIEVDDESEIRDKAWDYAYDFTSKYGGNEPYDVDWETLEGEE